MNAKALLPILFALLLGPPALSQGFAGLASDATGFELPQPGRPFVFPADHGPHPEFRIEWWYVTANLSGPDGTEYGLQWTLFRSALRPEPGEGWASPQIWMGHAAVTTPDAHFVAERFARGGIGQAGVRAEPFAAWIDDWLMDGIGAGSLTAKGGEFGYNMSLRAHGPFVPQGADGYSVKSSAGQASHYYSQPFYTISGTLDLPEGAVEVTGQAWLDREWSSQPLTEDQSGWDWFSLHFDDGQKLMGYRLRSSLDPPYTMATWIGADGTPIAYDDGALAAEPLTESDVEGRQIPTSWRLLLPDRGLDITVSALNPNSWMSTTVAYWEGPVRASGSHSGRGYLEMTGYD